MKRLGGTRSVIVSWMLCVVPAMMGWPAGLLAQQSGRTERPAPPIAADKLRRLSPPSPPGRKPT
jgi:hypothetical protein